MTKYLVGILKTLKIKLEKLHATFLNDLNKCSSELDINEDPLIDMKNTIRAFCNEYMPLLRYYNFFLFGYASTAKEILLMETFHPEMTIKELFPPPTCAINYEMDIVEKNILLGERYYFFDKKFDDDNKVSLLSYSGLILINEFLQKFNYHVTTKGKESVKPINSTKSEQNIEKIRLLFNNTANYLLPDIKYGELNSNSRSTTPTKMELSEYNSCFHTIYVTSNDLKTSLLLAYILNFKINLSSVPQISYCGEDELKDLDENEKTVVPSEKIVEELPQKLDIPYLNDNKDAVTTLCNNLLMSSDSNNILTVELSTSSLEIYAYGYTEGFLTKDDQTSTITFDYTKFTSNFANIHAVLERGGDRLYLYVLNLLSLLLNSVSMDSLIISHMINGDINIILSELVHNLTEKSFQSYFESIEESKTSKWDAIKKKNEKQNIRRRYSYAINFILSNITYNVKNNNIAHIKYSEDNMAIHKEMDSVSQNQEESLLSNLVSIFNRMDENKKVEILKSYADNWMCIDRSNVLKTNFLFHIRARTPVITYSPENNSKAMVPKKYTSSTVTTITNLSNERFVVHGIFSHEGNFCEGNLKKR